MNVGQFQQQMQGQRLEHLKKIQEKYGTNKFHYHTPKKHQNNCRTKKNSQNIQLTSFTPNPNHAKKIYETGKIRKTSNAQKKPLSNLSNFSSTTSALNSHRTQKQINTKKQKQISFTQSHEISKKYVNIKNYLNDAKKDSGSLKWKDSHNSNFFKEKDNLNEKDKNNGWKDSSLTPKKDTYNTDTMKWKSKQKEKRLQINAIAMQEHRNDRFQIDSNTCIKNVENIQKRIKNLLTQH